MANTQITPDLLNAVMAKQGAPNTTDNLNRIAEFAALHPGMLEQYIGQGTDAGMTGKSIDSSIAATDGVAPRGPADPNGYVSTVNPATGMSNIGPRLTNAPNIADPGRGRAAPSNAGRRGVAPPTEPPPGSIPTPSTPTAGTPDPLGTGDSLGVPWWLAPFAVRALPKPQLPPPFVQTPRGGLPAHLQQPGAETTGRVRPGGGVTDVNDLNAQSIGQEVRAGLPPPNETNRPRATDDPVGREARTPRIEAPPQQLPGGNPPTYPGGAPTITPNDINAATRDEVQKQVDAENLRNEIKNQNAKRNPTRSVRPGIR